MVQAGQTAVLIVAHPGHEALLHGWMERVRPRILILTDGSGRSGKPRINATSQYIATLGLKHGSLFGRFSDLLIYEKILAQDFAFFGAVANEICETLLAERVDYVVGDSAEGYNSVHDLCRMLVKCAVGRAERLSGRSIGNFDYPVVDSFRRPPPQVNDNQSRWTLDQATFDRKLAAVEKYYAELVAEVRAACDGTRDNSYRQYFESGSPCPYLPEDSGLEMFRSESIRDCAGDSDYPEVVEPPPYYERHGEEQAAAGAYERVIRYTEHMMPIASYLQEHRSAGIATGG